MSVNAAFLDEIRRLRAPGIFRTAVRMAGSNWSFGALTFVLPNGETLRLVGQNPGPDARLMIKDFGCIRRALMSGDIGFAEGYIAREWDTPDLAALLGAFSMNFDNIEQLGSGSRFSRWLHSLRHALHSNTKHGSKRNIHAHYDLGNAFYSRWLDPTMTYSAARYTQPGQDLASAQTEKYAALARSIGLAQDQTVLEIGCGWGGFAEFAAKQVGARVTGITISKEQYEYSKKRMYDNGLAEKADIRLIDYRDVTGQFDRIASIEMFEAVGEKYWPTYFSAVRDRLKSGGQAGLQIITIKDELFDGYRRRSDFIQKYIFPGGMLPSEERLKRETRAVGLDWCTISRFGQDYADTLAEWMRRFDEAWHDIVPLGFDERFRRLWRFYLAYCEAGFRSARTNVVQLTLAKA